MKISKEWLQTYFEAPLPSSEEIARLLTFHAFEIESVENDILDVKITPNRGHDCLSHRGIAKEVSAILNIPLKNIGDGISYILSPKTAVVQVMVENAELCPRFTAAYIKNLKVGPSPKWMKERLESIGQRSINNVVDITNYVMFDIGQPLHAFDAGKLAAKDGSYAMTVRNAKKGEKLMGLDKKEYSLSESMLAITDSNTSEVLSVAGIKGGMSSGIDETTTHMILEAANWNGVNIRKTSQALKLRTDASQRFEQVLSPEIASLGLHHAARLIAEIAGGETVGYVDEYPNPQKQISVSVTLAETNQLLGTSLTPADIADAFTRLGFIFKQTEDEFEVSVPFERLDITITQDLIEEVARIVGLDKIAPVELSEMPAKSEINAHFYWGARIREYLTSQGFSEVYTSVFAETGERVVLNKVDGVRAHMRDSVVSSLQDALDRNVRNKDLLGLTQVRIFEIGSVWKDGVEKIVLGLAVEAQKKQKNASDFLSGLGTSLGGTVTVAPSHLVQIDLDDLVKGLPEPKTYDIAQAIGDARYMPFSKYPFIVRDIALWVSSATTEEDILSQIKSHAGELLVRASRFDKFEKDGRTSYAFRLVFQSFDRTLIDDDANERMESVYAAVKAKGWEVR